MPGGASREIWSFDAAMSDGATTTRRSMVLRRDPGAHKIDTSRRHEFLVMRAAFEEGVPVPEVLWLCEDPSVLGASFFIMEKVEGETIARRLLRDDANAKARAVMPAQLAAILAKIHRIDAPRHQLDFLADPGDRPAATEVTRYEETFRRLALEPHPAFELALRWLHAHIPKTARTTLVHGDYRIGNVIFGPEGVRAILDWELAHVGDPIEDLGWLCTRQWRFGGEPPAGGIGTREALIEAYEKAGGGPVDPAALAFWEACGSFKVALVWISQSRVFLDGRVRSVELAALGRRTAEPEAELLRIMEEWR
jgi:aminoglycoside phosphotransferase (APT) family kinase protein